MSALLSRWGGFWIAPRSTLARIAAGQGGTPLEAIVPFVVVQLLLAARVLYRTLSLSGEAPRIAFRRAGDALWMLTRNDVLLWVFVVAVLIALGRFVATPRRSARSMAAAASYLLLPVLLLQAIGGITMWTGFDQWWLPHHPVDSYVVIVKNRVDWTRFLLKCAVAYGPSALLLVDLVVGVFRGREVAQEPPRPTGSRFAGFAFVSGLLLLGLGAGADVVAQAERLRPALPGDELPEESLPWLDGTPEGQKRAFRPKDYRGKVLILDFWASWCTPCRRSMPELVELQKELGPRGLQVIGVNRERFNRPQARQALRDIAPEMWSVVDTRGYGERLGLQSLPTSYVVDREGVLRHLHLGYTDLAKVRAEVEALLD
jgi:thiol-disulfide isomerase/thioredoxin